MSAADEQKHIKFASKLTGKAGSTIVFVIATVIAEFLVVLYAMSVGIQDSSLIQLGPFTFSLMFHLVPIIIVVVLAFTWVYLTSEVDRRPRVVLSKREKEKQKSVEPRPRNGIARRLHLTSPAVKAAFMVLVGFAALLLLVSFIAYPGLIYQSTSGAYQGDASLSNFVRSVAQAFSPVLSPIAGFLSGGAPAFGALAAGVGNFFRPIAGLDNASKYLVFQNGAAWILVIASWLYVEYLRRGYLFRKARR